MTEAATSQSLPLPPRPPWPDYPHSDLLHHVVYEFDMLWFTRGWLSNLNAQPASAATQMVTNAVLESFAVHVRSIVEFIYRGDKSRPTDIKAAALVDNPAAWAIERDHSDQGVFAHFPLWDKANKRIAHLTIDRTDEPGKGWDLDEVLPLARQEVIFYSHLKDEHKVLPPRKLPEVLLAMHISAHPLASAPAQAAISSGSVAQG